MPETPTIALTAEQLQTVREILRRHIPDAAVRADGSRVKGTATGKSDLDMVAFGNVEKQIQSLREDFYESSRRSASIYSRGIKPPNNSVKILNKSTMSCRA